MTAISSDRGFEASGTRYAELASALVKEIVGGSHVVGSLLPTEHELAERHGMARTLCERHLDCCRISATSRAGRRLERVSKAQIRTRPIRSRSVPLKTW